MIVFIYCIIIFIATTLGACVGLGGGVIIKPMLDLIGHDTVDAVGFISSSAVFAMSIAATLNHIRSKTKFNVAFIVFVSAGSALGGIAGNKLFDLLLDAFSPSVIKGIQGVILGALLVGINLYINAPRRKSFEIKNKFGIFAGGFFLGMLASFLGVGGGPINVGFLVLFFSMSMKDAAVYSVAVIFFSQLTKLFTIYAENQFQPYDLKMLVFILPCAVIGGILGAKLNKSSDEKKIRKLFTACVYAVAAVSFYNGFTGLFIHP